MEGGTYTVRRIHGEGIHTERRHTRSGETHGGVHTRLRDYTERGPHGEGRGDKEKRPTWNGDTPSGILKRDSSRMCALWLVTELNQKIGRKE